MEALVTTEWLAGEIGSPDLALLDASYTSTIPGTIPGSPPSDPRAAFEAGHIPGARFLDLDTLRDPLNPLPSTVPSAEAIAERLGSLGVTPEMRVLLYDDGGHHTACRAWWLLRIAGVDASILDGGIPKWIAEGRPLEQGTAEGDGTTFPVRPAIGQLRTLDQMRANLKSRAEQVADARSAARFSGDEPDPRPGCAPGHIPGSRNIPSGRFFNADGTWKQGAALEAVFAEAGIDPARPFVATCGSGITAAIIVFGAHLLGHEAALYDGSWTEWGTTADTPKHLGAVA
ncbi:sulfurtransferase [Sphingomonas sp.]|uniref:sulfurtransferase n=1 Tax=Sphingomonas sp. TaxID=28214 RepID=UPI001B158833|nr:sulfurtransferase [Sphingomonas sp.]MBO9714357.1 sulfurtransferase [Sphingomonas sp.]